MRVAWGNAYVRSATAQCHRRHDPVTKDCAVLKSGAVRRTRQACRSDATHMRLEVALVFAVHEARRIGNVRSAWRHPARPRRDLAKRHEGWQRRKAEGRRPGHGSEGCPPSPAARPQATPHVNTRKPSGARGQTGVVAILPCRVQAAGESFSKMAREVRVCAQCGVETVLPQRLRYAANSWCLEDCTTGCLQQAGRRVQAVCQRVNGEVVSLSMPENICFEEGVMVR